MERETEAGPAGSKGLEIGALIVVLAKAAPALAGIVRTVQAWALRGGRSVKLNIDGDTIEVSGASSEQQDRLIAAWIERHEQHDA